MWTPSISFYGLLSVGLLMGGGGGGDGSRAVERVYSSSPPTGRPQKVCTII